MNAALGFAGILVFLLGIAQLVAGHVGIEQGLGPLWAALVLFAALVFRFTLPITIGAFFGAMNVWGWRWALAALFAAPGILLIIPGFLGSVLSVAMSGLRSTSVRWTMSSIAMASWQGPSERMVVPVVFPPAGGAGSGRRVQRGRDGDS